MRRLATVRTAAASGIHLGAYGWLDDLRPAAAVTSQGYVHAPSLAQAATAAVLRSGHLAHHDAEHKALELDLTSARVRTALLLLDGVAAGPATRRAARLPLRACGAHAQSHARAVHPADAPARAAAARWRAAAPATRLRRSLACARRRRRRRPARPLANRARHPARRAAARRRPPRRSGRRWPASWIGSPTFTTRSPTCWWPRPSTRTCSATTSVPAPCSPRSTARNGRRGWSSCARRAPARATRSALLVLIGDESLSRRRGPRCRSTRAPRRAASQRVDRTPDRRSAPGPLRGDRERRRAAALRLARAARRSRRSRASWPRRPRVTTRRPSWRSGCVQLLRRAARAARRRPSDTARRRRRPAPGRDIVGLGAFRALARGASTRSSPTHRPADAADLTLPQDAGRRRSRRGAARRTRGCGGRRVRRPHSPTLEAAVANAPPALEQALREALWTAATFGVGLPCRRCRRWARADPAYRAELVTQARAVAASMTAAVARERALVTDSRPATAARTAACGSTRERIRRLLGEHFPGSAALHRRRTRAH